MKIIINLIQMSVVFIKGNVNVIFKKTFDKRNY